MMKSKCTYAQMPMDFKEIFFIGTFVDSLFDEGMFPCGGHAINTMFAETYVVFQTNKPGATAGAALICSTIVPESI